ncbi:MAG: hypothetical protein R3F05_08385 [Planctomycetota bacterium]
MEVQTTPSGWRGTTIASGHTDGEGHAQIPAIDPRRTLKLSVEAFGGRPDLGPLEFKDWLPADATYTLPAGFVLDVTVLDSEGRPVRALVSRESRSPSSSSTVSSHTDPAGHMTLRGLDPDATYYLFANHPDDPRGPSSPPVQVTATSSSVSVTLQLPAK